MQRSRCIPFLLTLIVLAMPLFAAAQNNAIPTAAQPPFSLARNAFIETEVGYADLTKSLIQWGDSSVTAVPSATGPAWFLAAGVRIRPWVRVKFEREEENVTGKGAFAQRSRNPDENGGANGDFGIQTKSKMAVVEFDPFSSWKIDPFIGAGFGKTTVWNRFGGASDPVTVMDPDSGALFSYSQQVYQRGRQGTWDGTFRAGVRYRPTPGIEMNLGFYFKDSVGVKGGLVLFPGEIASRILRR